MKERAGLTIGSAAPQETVLTSIKNTANERGNFFIFCVFWRDLGML